jgi:5'-nucleotidase
MKILLTNDDGVNSSGINSAFDTLSQHHDVFLIAPDTEKSACSNAITVRTQLSIKKIAENKFSVSGFPADCVIIGLTGDLIPDVDLVVSGINHGPNVGDDLFFSGTVAGARTAYIFGKSALSVSINCYKHIPKHINEAATFLQDFINDSKTLFPGSPDDIEKNMMGNADIKYFFNINYPDLPPEKIRGRKITYMGRRLYKDSFNNTALVSGEVSVQMGGYIESVFAEGSDSTELEKGYITITPLMLDCTDYSFLKKNFAGFADG